MQVCNTPGHSAKHAGHLFLVSLLPVCMTSNLTFCIYYSSVWLRSLDICSSTCEARFFLNCTFEKVRRVSKQSEPLAGSVVQVLGFRSM